MTNTPNATAASRPGPVPLTTSHKWMLGGLGTGSLALAVMAFKGMFGPVRDAMRPWFHANAWMIPVGTDLGIILTSLFNVYLELTGMRLWWLRWVTLLFLGLQLGINIGVADGDPLGSAGHAVLPSLFITIVEVWIYLIRKRRKAAQTEPEKVEWRRYLADFSGSREIAKLMTRWGITYATALNMLQQQKLAFAHLHIIYGKRWESEAPYDLLVMLHMPDTFDQAIKDIAKKLAEYRKGQKQVSNSEREISRDLGVNPSDGPRNENAGNPRNSETANQNSGKDGFCCDVHWMIFRAKEFDERQPVELSNGDRSVDPIGNAERINNIHIAEHGSAIGRDNLGLLFKLGAPRAKKLRDDLAARRESGARPGSGSGLQSGARPGPGSAVESGSGSGSQSAGESGRVLAGVGSTAGGGDG